MNYWRLSSMFGHVYANPKYPLTPLRKLVSLVQYGISERATDTPIGVPIVRMNNLQNDGWDLSDLKYIDLPQAIADSFRLHPGDILFNRTNSKELVGKCEVFREAGHWVFASYLIRVSFMEEKALPQFVSDFLNARAGRLQIDRISRQIIGMSNINAEELQDLLIPLPPVSQQARFAEEMDKARATRQKKLKQAEELLSSLDAYLLETFGLTPSLPNTKKTFAVRSRQLWGNRIDATAYQPFFSEGDTPRAHIVPLSELALIDMHSTKRPEDETTLVPYVGLPECSQNEVREVVMRPYSEVKGRSVVKPGDILFARIEPSVFNKKYVLAEDLKGYDYAYTSTEFYVVTPKPDTVDPYYLYAMFFCAIVFNQVKGQTTGSSGRRRLSSESFKRLQIPKPAIKVQQIIAAEVKRRREKAQRLKAEAEAEWTAAKERFEKSLLGEDVAVPFNDMVDLKQERISDEKTKKHSRRVANKAHSGGKKEALSGKHSKAGARVDGLRRRARKLEDAERVSEYSEEYSSTTRFIESSLGIKSYAELAPHLAKGVERVMASLLTRETSDLKITPEFVRSLHKDAFGELFPSWAGSYRDRNVIVGKHTAPPYYEVPLHMHQYCEDVEFRLLSPGSRPQINDVLIETLAFAEGRFLSIHPFLDFNGRVARMLLFALLYRLDLPPVELAPDEKGKAAYLKALSEADRFNWEPLGVIWRKRFGLNK